MSENISDEEPMRRHQSSSYCTWETTGEYEQRKELLIKITKSRTGLDPKPGQLRFAMALIMGKDVTCVAATGFGKSLEFQMAAMFLQGQFGVIIMPIEALGADQVASCNKIRLKAACLVEGDVDRNSVKIREILQGKYDLGKTYKISDVSLK